MDFRMLGPLDVVVDGASLPLGGPKQRAVLASLVLHANQIVSTDALVDAVWADNPPKSPLDVVRTYVSRLRGILTRYGHGVRLDSRPPGYVLTIDPGRLDAHRFEDLAKQGQREIAAGDPRAASTTLRRALTLWRGDVLADLTRFQRFQSVGERLAEMRLAAVEDRIDADLALGRHTALIGELEEVTTRHPFRERLWAQLIVALYRAGRQADALAAYRSVRATLVGQLGIDPGPQLQALEAAVLRQARDLDWPTPARDLPRDHRDTTHPAARGRSTGDQYAVIAAHVEAGQRALGEHAFDHAFRRFRAATELIETGEGDETDPGLAYTAWFGLAMAAVTAGRWPDDQRAGYLRAASIARAQGWAQRLALAAIGWAAHSSVADSPRPETGDLQDGLVTDRLLDEALARLDGTALQERCVVLAFKAVHAAMLDRGDEARALLTSVDDLARSSDEPTTSASALVARCWALLGSPRPNELSRCLEQALHLAVAPEVRLLLDGYILSLLAVPSLQRGDRPAFDAVRARIAAHPSTPHSPHVTASLHMWDAAVALASGRVAEGAKLAATLPGTAAWSIWDKVSVLQMIVASGHRGDYPIIRSRLAQAVAVTPHVAMLRAGLAYVRAREGQFAEARQEVETLRPPLRDGCLGLSAPITLSCLSYTAAYLRAADLADDLLAVLSDHSGQLLVSYTGATIDGSADRMIGQALIAAGRLTEAIDRLAAAQELEQAFGAELLALHSAYWQARARLERDRGRDEDIARELLSWAHSGARRLGLARFEQDCLAIFP